jgi:glyoxylase I family protein
MPQVTGPPHVDFTATDVERSARWWEEVMGFKRFTTWKEATFHGRNLWHASGFTVGLIAHDTTAGHVFDETRVGLDHFSLAVADRAELERWVEHLDRLEVTHTGIIPAH